MKNSAAIFFLAVALLAGNAAAQDPAPSAMEREFRANLMLDKFARVEYHDADGKTIDFDAFMKAVAAKKSFSMEKETDHSLAVVKVGNVTAPGNAPAARGLASRGPAIGTALPALDAGMALLDGRAFVDADLRGHPTLLSLFFAECAPCVAEVPALNAFAKAHPEIPLYALTFDDAATAREFVHQRGLEVPVAADAQAYLDRMHVDTYPMLLLLDAQGRIAAVRTGGGTGDDVVTREDLERWVGAAN